MLSAPDAELVRRDPAIPGLSLLLDPDAFVTKLRARMSLATSIDRASISYIRYKPGTNCLVAYRFEVAGTELGAHAIAYCSSLADKLNKFLERKLIAGPLGPGGVLLADCATAVFFAPNDGRLKSLRRLADPHKREVLLRAIFPNEPVLRDASIQSLRYKPLRRYVAKLCTAEGVEAALKIYTKQDFPTARANANALDVWREPRVARLFGQSERFQALAFAWLPGRPLSEIVAALEPRDEILTRVGEVMAQLHMQDPAGLAASTREAEAAALTDVASGIADVCPLLSGRAADLARKLAARTVAAPVMEHPVHGDCYAQQIIVADGDIGMLDFDRACRGDPATDLGNFLAHLERDVLEHRLGEERAERVKATLLEGYERAASHGVPAHTTLYTAAGLLKLASEPFRRHANDWPARIETIVARAEAIAATLGTSRVHPISHRSSPKTSGAACGAAIAIDPRMPFLSAALDPAEAQRQFQAYLPRVTDGRGHLRVHATRLMRHKLARRCLIEYDIEIIRPDTLPERLTLVGKGRAKGLDKSAYKLLASLWSAGFDYAAEDGVAVPEPIALVPPFHMWLQRKVPGTVATALLPQPCGVVLAERIALAAHKLHRRNVPTQRQHTTTDELRILRDRLARVTEMKPAWAARLTWVMNACERLGATVSRTMPCGIHRDFYPDQIIVDGARLYLLDLDLYCQGDPSLDIGNFLGHLTEQALRTLGDPDALAEQEAALEARFLTLCGGASRFSIQTYKTLTLARHIFISTQVPERRALTESLLELCEQRLSSAAHRRIRAMPVGPVAGQTS